MRPVLSRVGVVAGLPGVKDSRAGVGPDQPGGQALTQAPGTQSLTQAPGTRSLTTAPRTSTVWPATPRQQVAPGSSALHLDEAGVLDVNSRLVQLLGANYVLAVAGRGQVAGRPARAANDRPESRFVRLAELIRP